MKLILKDFEIDEIKQNYHLMWDILQNCHMKKSRYELTVMAHQLFLAAIKSDKFDNLPQKLQGNIKQQLGI